MVGGTRHRLMHRQQCDSSLCGSAVVDREEATGEGGDGVPLFSIGVSRWCQGPAEDGQVHVDLIWPLWWGAQRSVSGTSESHTRESCPSFPPVGSQDGWRTFFSSSGCFSCPCSPQAPSLSEILALEFQGGSLGHRKGQREDDMLPTPEGGMEDSALSCSQGHLTASIST